MKRIKGSLKRRHASRMRSRLTDRVGTGRKVRLQREHQQTQKVERPAIVNSKLNKPLLARLPKPLQKATQDVQNQFAKMAKKPKPTVVEHLQIAIEFANKNNHRESARHYGIAAWKAFMEQRDPKLVASYFMITAKELLKAAGSERKIDRQLQVRRHAENCQTFAEHCVEISTYLPQ